MKRSFFAMALLACASVAVACYGAVTVGFTKLKAWMLDGIALVAGDSGALSQPVKRVMQAKAFMLRIAKRERPVLTASWRMCPST